MNSRIVSHEVVLVTPDLAEKWLESNYEHNRSIKSSHKAKMAADMKAGAFDSENGQTIVRGEDGRLYDGQHRLGALVDADVSLPFLVVTISDGEEAFTTIDANAPRQASDFLYGVKNKALVAALARIGYSIERTDLPLLSAIQGLAEARRTASRAEVLGYARERIDMLEDAARDACRIRKAVGCGKPTAYGTFVVLVRYVGRDMLLDEFISDISEAAPMSRTVTAFKTMVLKQQAKGLDMTQKWLLGTILDAYEHFCDMDESTMLNQRMKRLNAYNTILDAVRNAGAGEL